jgi:hypothetical protein
MSNRAMTQYAWSSHREKGQRSLDFLGAIVPHLQTLVGQVTQSAAVKSKSRHDEACCDAREGHSFVAIARAKISVMRVTDLACTC